MAKTGHKASVARFDSFAFQTIAETSIGDV